MIKINNFPVNTTLFSDNTSQVWKLPEELLQKDLVEIDWDYQTEGEVMQLAQLKDLLDSYGVEAGLSISYLPYARQDKGVGNQSTFALRTFSKILNAMHFKRVNLIDPHSDLAYELINNSYGTYPVKQVQDLIGNALICYPDKGAQHKYADMYGVEYLYGLKIRDQSTGNITDYQLIGNPEDRNILIVDDICDGGATFCILTKALKEKGAKEVNLFVTHGIFSKGLKVLKDAGINKIYTKDGEVFENKDGNIIYENN